MQIWTHLYTHRVTMSVHKLTAGDGYLYLIRQVAVSDATDLGPRSLEAYYSEKGERPGRWVGRGIAGLGVAGIVTEAQMKALFGEGLHPDADRIQAEMAAAGCTEKQIKAAIELGSKFMAPVVQSEFPRRLAAAYGQFNVELGRPQRGVLSEPERATVRTRVARDMFAEELGRPPGDDRELSGWIARNTRPDKMPVAGFDFTFSPVKSVSTLWAVAPREMAAAIEAAHDAAVAEALEWFQDNAAFTRAGGKGERQIDITGVTGAMFTHRDSRAGDPDLHTHVAISNKVQTRDGKWRALDGRLVYKANVAMSEIYNSAIERNIRDAINVRFADREDQSAAGKRSIREIVGVPPELMGLWSSRRLMIEERHAELVAQFRAEHGRTPTAKEQIALAQTATLDTREAKHEPRALAEQRAQWQHAAVSVLGERGISDMLVQVTHEGAAFRAAKVTPHLLDVLTDRTMAVISDHRSTWQFWHVQAEAMRQVRAAGVPADQELSAVGGVVTRALSEQISVRLQEIATLNPDVAIPAELLRANGEYDFTVHGSTVYTSTDILAAEQRVVDAAGRFDGRRISDFELTVAFAEMHANGIDLNTGQRTLVTATATSGARVQLALAPAGSGKTTAMRTLARAWEMSGGTIVGLAPSASAANELATSIGAAADTLDKLTWHTSDPGTRGLEPWMRAIGPGTLVIIDEAGLASTRNLDIAVRWLLDRGASIRLVGDDKQLSSVASGGLLRNIASAYGYVTLNEIMRFSHAGEGAASLAIRDGDTLGLAYYLDNGRVHVGDASSVLDQAYATWSADKARGWDSVMLAGTHEQVSALNLRARTARLAELSGPVGREVNVGSGLRASVGDIIITKKNQRRLSLGQSDFVRNGYRFTITDVHTDGTVLAVHTGTGRTVRLPQDYVAEHVLLGYAATFSSAQGMTVGSKETPGSAHTIVDPTTMTREQFYTALTRARSENRAYVTTVRDGDEHDIVRPETINPETAGELLAGVLARSGAQVSAMTAAAQARDPLAHLERITARYTGSLIAAAAAYLGQDRMDVLEAAAEALVPGVTAAGAWPTLHTHLALLELQGLDPIGELTVARDAKGLIELASARDTAAVLDWRLDREHRREHDSTAPAGPLPWLHAVPALLSRDPQWGSYLRQVEWHVADVAHAAGELALTWAEPGAVDVPVWVRPLLAVDAHPALVARVAVWRYAHGIDDVDRRPTGPPAQSAYERAQQRDLNDQVTAAGYLADKATAEWSELGQSIDPRLVSDPYWPLLAARLESAQRAGKPHLATTVREAAALRPLPDEQPAQALWWRLAEAFGVDVTAAPLGGVTLRPEWSRGLDAQLGQDVALRVLAAPLWPAVVARVDAAARADATLDPARLLADAVDAAAHLTARPGELAESVLWHISLLTDPEPTDAEAGPLDPQDPQAAAFDAPHDLHELDQLDLLDRLDHLAGPAEHHDWSAEDLLVGAVRQADVGDPAVTYDDGFEPADDDWFPPTDAELATVAGAPTVEADGAGLGDWADLLSADPDVPPYRDLDPEDRVTALSVDLATARAALAAQVASIEAGEGTHLVAARPMIRSMRERADELRPAVLERDGSYQEWVHADRAAETAAHAVDEARAVLAAAIAGGADDYQISVADAGVFMATAQAGTLAADAAEAHHAYLSADEALTAVAGPAGVIRDVDVDRVIATARELDDDATLQLRLATRTLADQLLRAEMTAARAAATPALAALAPSTQTTTTTSSEDAVQARPDPRYRWADLLDRLAPRVSASASWPELAAGLDRAAAAGWDVEANLPELLRDPLDEYDPGLDLQYRLVDQVDAAITPAAGYARPGADDEATSVASSERDRAPTLPGHRSGPAR